MKAVKFLLPVLCAFVLSCCGGADNSGSADSSPTETASHPTTESEKSSENDSSEEDPSSRRVYELDPEKPVIALTFDDGPNTSITPRVLDRLEKYDVPATFFLIGNNINEKSSDVVRRACDMGCEIECHSLTHSYMDKMQAEDIRREIDEVSGRIYDIIGERPKFFRPPYFAVSDVMYENIDMTFITGFGVNDWEASVSAEQRVQGVLNNAKDGAVILLHDMEGNFKTVEALDSIIPQLKDKGYQLVTVSQLFEAKNADPSDKKYRNRVISVVD